MDLKAQERENAYERRKNKKEEAQEPLTLEAKQNFKKLKESINKKVSNKIYKNRLLPVSPINEMCQEWLVEFDELKKKGNLPKRIVTAMKY